MRRSVTTVLAFGLALGATACNDTPLIPEVEEEAAFAVRLGSEGTTYILNSGRWTDRQTRAVERAGGSVVFSHEADGIGIASSAAPDFLDKALASKAFTSGFEDFVIEGIAPTEVQALEDASFDPNDDGFFAYQWNLGAIGVPDAWAAGCTGAGVRIAVLDGGISSDHIDIAPNLDVASSASFVPGYAFDEDIDDDFEYPGDGPFRHATHVAGIAAAPANGLGTIGVAPDATIIGVKVLNGGSGYFSWILEGIYYAATPQSDGGAGADIINMSLSGAFPKNIPGGGQLVAAYNKALNYAARMGVLVVSAAGNDYWDLDHNGNYVVIPAESGNGIAISATAPNGWWFGAMDFSSPASYTNYGNSVIHVSAPGGDFDVDLFDAVLSPGEGPNWYYFAAGTSMAAPHVAGTAALVMEANPGVNVNRVKTILAQAADDAGKKGNDPYHGKGFLNAYAACMK